MGLEEKAIESIIEAHSDTVNGLKSQRDKALEEAKKVPDLLRQLEEAKDANKGSDEWQKKCEQAEKALADYKSQVEAKEAEEAKARAYRQMLTTAGIDPRRLDSIMRVTDLSAVEMEDGKLKDEDKLAEGVKKEWADFVVKKVTRGSDPANPPKQEHGIDGADPDIAKMLQQRHERLFGKSNDSKE
jgi:phenylalanyl-tRNA synthetase alpha subunit